MFAMLIVHIIFAAVGVMFAGFGIPLFREKVGPNGLYGFRTKATMSDRTVWFAVNKVLGRDLIILGVVQLAAAVIGYALAPNVQDRGEASGRAAFVQIVVLLVLFAAVTIDCVMVLRRVTASRPPAA